MNTLAWEQKSLKTKISGFFLLERYNKICVNGSYTFFSLFTAILSGWGRELGKVYLKEYLTKFWIYKWWHFRGFSVCLWWIQVIWMSWTFISHASKVMLKILQARL